MTSLGHAGVPSGPKTGEGIYIFVHEKEYVIETSQLGINETSPDLPQSLYGFKYFSCLLGSLLKTWAERQKLQAKGPTEVRQSFS